MRPGRLTVTCPVVVGRDDVLRLLRAQLDGVADRGRVTLLGGSAGMGKSRLLAEAARAAREAGHLVLAGECRQEHSDGTQPFTSALARYERTLLRAETELLFDGRARPARALLPTVFPGEPVPRGGAPVLAAAVVELLGELAAYQPVTLLLEDLQWADRDAVELLLALAVELPALPVWVVGTYRPDEVGAATPFTRLLTLLDRRHPDERVLLDPLGSDAVGDLLGGAFPDRRFDPGFVTALHDRSGGNPYVVEELCRALLDRDRLGDPSGDVGLDGIDLPDTIRHVLLSRLDHVDPATRELLDVAAVAGEELDLPRLAAVLDAAPVDVESAVAGALEVGVLAERRDGLVPYFAFTHALTRDAIRGALPAPRRRTLHRRLAAVAADAADVAAGEVCDHLVAAGDAAAAYPWARGAARDAAARLRPREASDRFEQAVELAPTDHERAEVAVEAAEFGFYADRPAAVGLADRARRLAQAAEDDDLEARALVVLARTRWIVGDPDAFAPFERAMRLTSGRGDRRELEVLAEAAYHLARTGWAADAARADELVSVAAPLADRLDDDRARARLALVAAARASDQRALEVACREAAALLARAGDRWAEATADLLAGHHLVLFHGDLREGARRLRRHQREWDELTTRRPSVPFSGLALASIWMGDPTTAQALLAQGHWEDSDLSEANWREGMAELALARGRTREALDHARDGLALVEPLDEPAWMLPALGTMARAQLERTGLAVARETFERALDYATRSSLTYHWPFSPSYARALRANGELDALRRLAEQLGDATRAAGSRGHDVAALRYVEGLSSFADGALDRAATAFEDSDARYAAMPFPARRIGAAIAWAEVDHRAGRLDDAVARARSALVLAQALGGPLLVERVEHLLAGLGRVGRRASAEVVGADALTPREREVVRLTVEGLTAREVGERLVISHRTVEGHLERARERLGAGTRADLVRIALELGV